MTPRKQCHGDRGLGRGKMRLNRNESDDPVKMRKLAGDGGASQILSDDGGDGVGAWRVWFLKAIAFNTT